MKMWPVVSVAVTLFYSLVPAQTIVAPAIPKMVLRADIGVRTSKDGQAQNGCSSNQPFTQDAPIWAVLLHVDAPGNLKSGLTELRKSPSFPLFHEEGTGNYYAILLDGPGETFSSTSLKGEPLTVHIRNTLGQVNMAIEGLTLAQLTDVAHAVKDNPTQFTGKLSSLGYIAKLYKVTGPATMTQSQFEIALIGGIDFTAANARDLFTQKIQSLTTAGPTAIQAAVIDTTTLGVTSLDPASFDQLDSNVKAIVQTGAYFGRKNTAGTSTVAGGNALTAAAATGNNTPAPPVFSIDEPCFGFSVTPILSGANRSLASTFRFRYDLYSAGGTSFLKLRANGDGAINGGYFNRAEASAELGVNNKGLVIVDGGGDFGYSFSRVGGNVVDEWTASGKFQVRFPPLLFVDRAGMQSRPMLSIDGGGAGGRHAQVGKPGTKDEKTFIVKAAFAYTLRPSERLSLDLTGGLGASSEVKFFNERRYFSNGRVEIRYNVSKDYDFLARYDCGRRNPDYMKYCGWTTGFTMIRGR